MIKKIAILTSGGDAPGMNNVIRVIIKEARVKQIEAYVVYEGYKGLHQGNIVSANQINVDEYISKGGTFIYSARFPEFKKLKIRQEAKVQLDKHGIDALVVIGGDGSYKGAQLLHELGIKTIALPGTIDNDIASSNFTIGYDTALNTIVDAVDKIRDTANSHNRVAIVEVMGRGCGDLALYSGIATGAEVIVINENKMTIAKIAQIVKEQIEIKNKRSVIVLVSEYIFDDLDELVAKVESMSGIVTRGIKLSHIQRGGNPTAQERINASLMGIKAMKLLNEGKSGLAIGILNEDIIGTPILDALSLVRKSRKKLAIQINKLNQS